MSHSYYNFGNMPNVTGGDHQIPLHDADGNPIPQGQPGIPMAIRQVHTPQYPLNTSLTYQMPPNTAMQGPMMGLIQPSSGAQYPGYGNPHPQPYQNMGLGSGISPRIQPPCHPGSGQHGLSGAPMQQHQSFDPTYGVLYANPQLAPPQDPAFTGQYQGSHAEQQPPPPSLGVPPLSANEAFAAEADRFTAQYEERRRIAAARRVEEERRLDALEAEAEAKAKREEKLRKGREAQTKSRRLKSLKEAEKDALIVASDARIEDLEKENAELRQQLGLPAKSSEDTAPQQGRKRSHDDDADADEVVQSARPSPPKRVRSGPSSSDGNGEAPPTAAIEAATASEAAPESTSDDQRFVEVPVFTDDEMGALFDFDDAGAAPAASIVPITGDSRDFELVSGLQATEDDDTVAADGPFHSLSWESPVHVEGEAEAEAEAEKEAEKEEGEVEYPEKAEDEEVLRFGGNVEEVTAEVEGWDTVTFGNFFD